MKKIITIDGPAGSGKSTVAKILAEKLGYSFLDTGAMYRAVTFAAMDKNIDFDDETSLKEILSESSFEFSDNDGTLSATLNGKDITSQIRQRNITNNVSKIAPLGFVRDKLVAMQRDFAEKAEKVVTEGRDQGTVVFPDAMVKFFLTADVGERAQRRHKEMTEKGIDVNIEDIKKDIEQRDKNDMERQIAPLRKAHDAFEIDTTGLDIEGVVRKLLEVVSRQKTA